MGKKIKVKVKTSQKKKNLFSIKKESNSYSGKSYNRISLTHEMGLFIFLCFLLCSPSLCLFDQ